jgi:hypothetical protein
MINFVDARRDIIVTVVAKLVQVVGSNLGFFLHDPGVDLCIFLDLLIAPSFFVMFHTS